MGVSVSVNVSVWVRGEWVWIWVLWFLVRFLSASASGVKGTEAVADAVRGATALRRRPGVESARRPQSMSGGWVFGTRSDGTRGDQRQHASLIYATLSRHDMPNHRSMRRRPAMIVAVAEVEPLLLLLLLLDMSLLPSGVAIGRVGPAENQWVC